METILENPEAIKEKSHKSTGNNAFEDFLINYKPILMRVENYLEEVIEKIDPAFVRGYIPWKKALHELITGVYLITKKIPLPNKEDFMEALCLFSFDSSIKFLRDICNICQLQLKRNWEKEFREHIDKLLFEITTLELQQKYSPSR